MSHKTELVSEAERYLSLHIQGVDAESPIDFTKTGKDENWFVTIEQLVEQRHCDQYEVSINNPYYDLRLFKYIKKCCKKVLLWCNALAAKMGSTNLEATSAGLESYHQHLKNRLLLGATVDLDVAIGKIEEHSRVLILEREAEP
jgi:hypothetical protein